MEEEKIQETEVFSSEYDTIVLGGGAIKNTKSAVHIAGIYQKLRIIDIVMHAISLGIT